MRNLFFIVTISVFVIYASCANAQSSFSPAHDQWVKQVFAEIKKGTDPFIALNVVDDLNVMAVVMTASELRAYLGKRRKLDKKTVNDSLGYFIRKNPTLLANDFDYDFLKTYQIDLQFYQKIKEMNPDVVNTHFFKGATVDGNLTPGMQTSVIFYMLVHDRLMIRRQPDGLAVLLPEKKAK